MPHQKWFGLLAAVAALIFAGALAIWGIPTQAHNAGHSATAAPGVSAATRPLAEPSDAAPQVAAPPLTPCPGSWSIQASYPISISQQAVVALGGAVYSFGGYVAGNFSADAYKYTTATNIWTTLAPLPVPRANTQAVSDGTAIYILGGSGPGGDYEGTNTLWRYDPTTDSYTTLAPYLIPTAGHAAAYLDGKIYRIAGGTFSNCGSQNGAINSVEVYTIATNAWAAAARYPQYAASLVAVSYNGFIYAVGGQFAGFKTYLYDPVADRWDDAAIADLPNSSYSMWGAASDILNGRWVLAGDGVDIATGAIAWNPATNVWEPLPPLLPRREFAGGATVGDAFYVVGGRANGAVTNDNQRYLEIPCTTPTPTSTLPLPTATATVCGVGSWHQEASIPTVLYGNALVAQGGRLYSFGGINFCGTNTGSGVWTSRAPLPAPRAWARAVSDDTNIYILGGSADFSTATNTLWRYDPVADTYTPLAPYMIPTTEHAAVLLNGKIYRIGGTLSNSASTASVEVYTIATNSWAAAADYPQAISELSAVTIGDYIYSGGGANSIALTKTYRYDPASDSWDDGAVADLPEVHWGAASAVYNGQWLIAGGGSPSGTSGSRRK